jgi:uncharacterized protein (TIGR01777 family)
MRVLISGATGLIGTELTRQLLENGDEPIALVKHKPRNSLELEWNPERGELDPKSLEGIDAVVNMAGATTGKIPWTRRYKEQIVNSRIDCTETLVNAINACSNPPKVLVSGSASGIYGDRGGEWLSEDAGKGSGFLSDLAHDWEQAALGASGKTRVVLARTTMVMSRKLGALGKLLPLLRLGLGGPLGSGKQWWAWISVVDEARAIRHLIATESASGPYNLTAPEPATCSDITKALAKGLRRPALLRVPAWAMRLLIGEAAQELLLCSQKMSADRLLETGFKFTHPTLSDGVRYVLSK